MKYIVDNVLVRKHSEKSLLNPAQALLASNRARRMSRTQEFEPGISYKIHNISIVRSPSKKYVYTFLNMQNKSAICKEFRTIDQADEFIDAMFQ